MKRRARRNRAAADRDTLRPEYDFSRAIRGVTAARYAEGANIVVVDRDVLDVFPDGKSVNEALRALAPVLRLKQMKRAVLPKRRARKSVRRKSSRS